MAQMDKNTVKSENQLSGLKNITFENEEGKGVRVLFVGNSITRHGVKEDIGWFNDWGMAASSKENDYVHLTKEKALESDKNATFCICQGAEWERGYLGEFDYSYFEPARNFGAEIVVMRLIENCRRDEFEPSKFKEEYKKLVDYLNSKNGRVIITSGFWKHPGDGILEEISKETGADFVYLGDLGEDSAMRADGLFEHSGVAHHPGDEGMKQISNRIFDVMKKYI